MKQTYVLVTIIAILIVLLILDFKSPKNVPSSEPLLRKRIQILELALSQSARERVAYHRYSDSLNHVNDNLIRVNNKYDSLLTKVKGTYNKLKPTELGNEMIRRYNSAR